MAEVQSIKSQKVNFIQAPCVKPHGVWTPFNFKIHQYEIIVR